MNQYSDYVVKYLLQSSMEDARRKAAGDRVCRQIRKIGVKGQSKGYVMNMGQILVDVLKRRPARASN
jgi:hypothetical protein